MLRKRKKENTLENLPFYNEQIEKPEKTNRETSYIGLLSELPFFYKEPKELANKELLEALPFFPEKPKRKRKPKTLTKYQILQNVLPFFDEVGIFKGLPHQYYAQTYNVEVVDSISLDDSLFLAKTSINDFFRDLLREKRSFK